MVQRHERANEEIIQVFYIRHTQDCDQCAKALKMGKKSYKTHEITKTDEN